MGTSCKLIPTIKKGDQEIASPLYTQLFDYTKDVKLSQSIYTLTQSQKARNIFKIAMGENNEADFNSVIEKINLINFLSPEVAIKRLEEKYKFVFDNDDNNPEYHVFNNCNDAFDKAEDFNNENKNYVARVSSNKLGASIVVEKINDSNKLLDKIQKRKRVLNDNILGMLHRLGFDVDREVPATDYSSFNAINAERNAQNLLEVIHIAKGTKGENDLPEEFAHFIIEGLQETDNVQRLLKQLTPDLVRAILADEYDKYVDLYDRDQELLTKEAAGKLLMNSILSKNVDSSYMDRQVRRVFEYAKNKLKLANEDELNSYIATIMDPIKEIQENLDSGEIYSIISKKAIINSKAILYAEKMNDKGKKLLEKKLIFLQKKYNKYDAELRNKGHAEIANTAYQTIQNIQDMIDQCNYARGIQDFISSATNELTVAQKQLTIIQQNIKNTKDIVGNIHLIHREIAQCKEIIKGYDKELTELTSMTAETAKEELGDGANILQEMAKTAKGSIDQLKTLVAELEAASLKLFMKKVFLTVPTYSHMDDSELDFLISKLLELGTKDLGFIDRFFLSPQLSSNLLYNFFGLVTDQAMAARDLRFKEAKHTIETLRSKIGSDDFMYERDADGVPTGYFKSQYNFKLWREDLHKEWEKLKSDTALSTNERSKKYSEWKQNNTQEVVVDEYTGRTEMVPLGDKYMLADPKLSMTKEQAEYYDAILDLKSEYESELPAAFGKRFKAPQVANDTLGLIENKQFNLKMASSLLEDQFIVRNYDTIDGDVEDYYEEPDDLISSKYIPVTTDLAGAQIKRVPTYFTRNIEDLNRLSTDCASSMKAYIAMIINHTELTKASDSLAILQDYIDNTEYEVRQSTTPLKDISQFGKKVYLLTHYEKGDTTKLSKAIRDYMDSVYYGDPYLTKTKNGTNSATIKVGYKTVVDENGQERVVPKELDLRKPVRVIQAITNLSALGLSVFAATGNIIDGINKKIVQSMGSFKNKESVDYKDMAVAEARFWKGFTEYGAINTFRMTTHGYNTLVNEMFDASGDTYERALYDKYRKSTFTRLLGKSSFSFMMTLGDTYMRSTSTLAILNHEKVLNTNTNEPISLYDAFEIVYTGKNSDVENMFFKKGIQLSNDGGKTSFEAFSAQDYIRMRELAKENAKKKFDELSLEATELSDLQEKQEQTNQYLTRIRMRVTRVNSSMLGSFNEAEKNRLSRSLLGSFLMQFRRWMPEIYADRFAAGKHITVETNPTTGEMKLVERHGNMNLQTGQIKEGMYITVFRFMKDMITPRKVFKDILDTQSKYKYLSSRMTDQEKSNFYKSITEFALVMLLTLLLKILGPVKDHKGSWAARYLAYTMMRARMELRSECPFALGFIVSSNMQLLKNPIPGVKTLDDIMTMIRFQDMFDTVQSGRYKGKSVWGKHFRQKFPLWRQFENLLNIDSDNTMFMQFKNQGTIRSNEDKANSNMYDKSNNKVFTSDNTLLKGM